MGHRSIILLVGAMCTFVACNVSALGLGKITLDSALNEPLNAKIELFEVRDLIKEEIRVQIATREDFDRIGVDKTYFLSDLKFKVVMSESGSPHIQVNSQKLVREPFLNFLVQVQWPSGKLLREFTLLMDLPVFASEKVAPVQSTSSASSSQYSEPSQSYASEESSAPQQQSNPDYNPRSSYEQAPARPAAQEVAPTYTEDSYRVRSNDTLWEIAAAVRPDRSVSIHQTMLAIQRENPEAFINNNINLLKSGQILRIPDRADMADLGRRAAVREVAVQNAAWSDGGEVGDAELSGSNAYAGSADDITEPEGRLTLSSPDETYDSSEGRASGGAADSSTEALENELAITMEQLDKSSRENGDLQSKVSSLEEQIETMERMLEVSNESMRALELSVQQNADAAERRAADDALLADDANLDDSSIDESSSELTLGEYEESTSDGSDLAESGESIESSDEFGVSEGIDDSADALSDATEDLAGESSDAVVDDVAEIPAPTVKPNSKRVVSTPPQPEKGIVDILLENILYIVAGIVVLAAGVFFLLRQKSSDEDDFDGFMEDHGLEENQSFEAPLEETPLEDDIDLGSFDGEAQPASDDVVEDELEELEDLDPEAQTEDVVTEADIYIAYGRFDRAEEMLTAALSSDPSDQDVRLKLLEVYSSQGDAERFDPHYAKLRAFASPSNIERAEALRESIPHTAEFDEDSFDTSDVSKYTDNNLQPEPEPESGSDSDSVGGGLDLGDELSVDLGDELSMDLDIPSDDGADEFSLDLDGLGDVSGDEENSEISLDLGKSEGDATDDFSLDLDLGDLDSDGDPDSAFNLDLPEDTEGNKVDEVVTVDLSDSADGGLDSLDIEFDLDASDSEGLDLDFDLGGDEEDTEISPKPELDVLDDDLSSGLSLDLGSTSASSDDSDSLDDLDLDLNLGRDEGGSGLGGSLDLDADLASLDAELDLSLDGDAIDSKGLDVEDSDVTVIRGRPEKLSVDLPDDLSADLDEEPLTVLDDELSVEPVDGSMSGDSSDVMDLGDLDLGDTDLGDLDLGDTELSLDLDDGSESGGAAFDLEADLASLDDDEISIELDDENSDTSLDLELDDAELSIDLDADSELAIDLGDGADLNLDLGGDSELSGDLSDDVADSGVDLDLNLSPQEKAEPELSLDLDDDLSLPNFDLEADLGSTEEDLNLSSGVSAVSGDTVINEALNDEYIEQKLSEDADLDMNFDEILPLEDGVEADPGLDSFPEVDSQEDEEELDLSSLDKELDALTAGVDDAEPAGSSVDTPLMDEPITDFDAFDDDLEKDEANAETVKSDHVSDKSVEDMGEDTMFEQAIQEVPQAESGGVEFELPEVDPDDVDDDDLDFLSDSDETATKLDLARAYIDMGDQEGARDIIKEVLGEGNDQQKSEAEGLLSRIEG